MTRILLCVPLAFSLVAPCSGFAQVNFNLQVLKSGDTASYGVAVGDFNNDGILDLVTMNQLTYSFYKGLGGGKYAAPVNHSVSSAVGQVEAADFDRDGRLDLAAVPPLCATGGVALFTGSGNGSFSQDGFIAVPGNCNFLAMADFNGDHIPDLAVSYSDTNNQNTHGVNVYLGDGKGHFTQASSLPVGGWRVVAGDFNGDGHQDLAVSYVDSTSHLAMYLGNGNGTFQTPLIADAPGYEGLAVGDFYNNRVQSLVGAESTYNGMGGYVGQIWTARYSGGKLLVENQNIFGNPVAVAFGQSYGGDLNGDFLDDVFVNDGSDGTTPLYGLGSGKGTFAGPYQGPDVGYVDQWQSVIRDVDGDSRHDVVTAFQDGFNSVGGVDLLMNTSAAVNCPLASASITSATLSKALTVNICAPYRGEIVGQTFTFKGSGQAFSGIAKRMELWIDGTKVAENLEDQLKATVSLSRGNHVASFVVVNTFDEHTSKSVNFTAQY